MLKVLQAKLQQYVNRELPDVQAGFRKGRGPRKQIAKICCIIKKAKALQKKTSTSATLDLSQKAEKRSSASGLTTPKTLCGSQQTVENSERDGHTSPPDLPLEKPVCRSGSNS